MINVRCPNPACDQASHLVDDGLNRVFRCPRCRTRLPHFEPHPRPQLGDGSTTQGPHLRRQRDTQEAGLSTASAPSVRRGGGDVDPRETSGPERFGITPRLGRLQLRDKLGAGAFATIYHAFDPLLERDVTLKVFHTAESRHAFEPGGSPSKDFAHFASEVKALARLRHPQIVPIYDAGCEGAYHFIAMAYLSGGTLAEAIAAHPFDWRQTARIIVEIAEALEHAHAEGIVHRDVKPSNIVLDAQGAAHLIDFGLAHRPGSDPVEDGGSRAGVIRGTPAYLAPEQATGLDTPPLPANDQYSLGAVFYELLCGQPPFSGPRLQVLVSALQATPTPPRERNSGVPSGLEAICLKTLAKQPGDRYPSCGALAEDLNRWLRGETPLAEQSGTRPQPLRRFLPLRQIAATFLAVLTTFFLTTLFLTLRDGVRSTSL